jgi:hypothetical protein
MSSGNSFDNIAAVTLDGQPHQASSHLVQFYEDDVFLIDSVSRMAVESLEAGDSADLIVTAAHRSAIEARVAQAL